RHEALRSNFGYVVDKGLRQLVYREKDVHFEVSSEAVATVREREYGHAFDLKRDALLRVVLVREDSRRHTVVLTWHHIILDGWSMVGVLLGELFAIHREKTGGEAAGLRPAWSPGQHARWLQERPREQAKAFWADFLEGFQRWPTPGWWVNRDDTVAGLDGKLVAAIRVQLGQ